MAGLALHVELSMPCLKPASGLQWLHLGFLVYAIGFGGTHSYLFLSFSDFHLKSLADAGNSSQVVVNPVGLGLAQVENCLYWDSGIQSP